MATKSKARSQASKPRTRRSIVGQTIYPASVEPSPRAKRVIEALTPATAKVVRKRNAFKQVVADQPKVPGAVQTRKS